MLFYCQRPDFGLKYSTFDRAGGLAMSNDRIVQKDGKFFPPTDFAAAAHLSSYDQYKEMYDRSIADPDGFWAEIASDFHWEKKWDKVFSYNYNMDKGKVDIRWFEGGKTNITYNCIDRHLATRGDQRAILWEGNEPTEDKEFTYNQLSAHVNKFSNALKDLGVKKGDRVTIYMPMVPELAFAMLACARIGAIHSIVFGGFSPEALKDRIVDCDSTVLITANGTFRGKKPIDLKANADKAMDLAMAVDHKVEHCVVVNRIPDLNVAMTEGRDLWWDDVMKDASAECTPEWMDSEDPLFILYTSGSTGKPKGVLHTVGGYMVYAALTHKYVFDYQDGDVYWCTADIGWVTGHSYIVYGPLANGRPDSHV